MGWWARERAFASWYGLDVLSVDVQCINNPWNNG